MNCADARLLIGADPAAKAPALEEHLRACDACRGFRREMLALDEDIRRALAAEPALHAAAPRAPERTRPARPMRPGLRRLAVAASMLVTIAAGAFLFGPRPADALAADVLTHVAGEPGSWSVAQPVAPAEVAALLQAAGVALDADAHAVTYASACPFRGRTVPHLVVTTHAGPVTVIVLTGERVAARREFAEDGYEGVLVPAPRGSVAVIARGTAEVDEAARLVMAALRFDAPGAPAGS
jgi:hypothetical protein